MRHLAVGVMMHRTAVPSSWTTVPKGQPRSQAFPVFTCARVSRVPSARKNGKGPGTRLPKGIRVAFCTSYRQITT